MEFLCEEARGVGIGNGEGVGEKGGNGGTGLDLAGFDLVYLAALVGSSQRDKERLLVGVVERMRMGALLVVRTAHSLRGLLYPVCCFLFELGKGRWAWDAC